MKTTAGKCFALMLFISFTSGAYSMPPVKMTNDKTTSVDLTGSDLLEKQKMQDCQLRLEGPPSDYRLAYGGGSIPVPTKAVKAMQDGYWADIAVSGNIGGLAVRMLSIPYFVKPLTEVDIYGLDGRRARFVGHVVSHYIVFGGHESVVEPKLRALWPEGVMLNHRNHPNPNRGTLQFLREKDIPAASGWDGIEPLQSPKTTTTVNYNCILRHDAARKATKP